MRTWLSSVILAIALVSAISAQQLGKPAGQKPPGPSQTIQFKVSIEPEALVLRRESLEDKSVITHVTLTPASGEPVFHPDLARLAEFAASRAPRRGSRPARRCGP